MLLAHLLRGYWHAGERRYLADCRGAGGEWGGRDKAPVALCRRRTIGVRCRVTDGTSPRKCADIWIWRCVAIREYFEKCNDLVLLRIREAEHPRRHVDNLVVVDFGRWPAGYFFDSPWRAVSRRDREWIHVTRVVEMYQLLEALDIAVVKKLLLEIRLDRAGLRGGALCRRHSHIARGGHLHLTVDRWCVLCPTRVWVGRGADAASKKCSQSQISVAEAVRIPREAENIRSGLIVESIPRIEWQPFIGRTETGEQRRHKRGLAVVGGVSRG